MKKVDLVCFSSPFFKFPNNLQCAFGIIQYLFCHIADPPFPSQCVSILILHLRNAKNTLFRKEWVSTELSQMFIFLLQGFPP